MTYEQLIEAAEQNCIDGVDIVYLPEDEFNQAKDCLIQNMQNQLVLDGTTTNIPKDSFVFMGLTYQKQ
jgi:hypothetical protein